MVASDMPALSSRARKRIRAERNRVVKTGDIRRAIQAAVALGPGIAENFEASRRRVIEELKNDADLQKAVAEQLRRGTETDLNQSHDFMQLVKLVRGYAEKLLHERHPDLPPEKAAELLANEGSIYFATTLMIMKVDALLFINEMYRATGDEERIRIHPLVLQYVRIYNWQARQKNVEITLGECWSDCEYNKAAIGAVVHGILDNLVKYAPAGSSAHIEFVETASTTTITFDSLGPRIDRDERAKIFLPRYRADAARSVEGTGQGIGLASVKHISDALGLQVRVEQDEEEDRKFRARYRTRFSFTLRSTTNAAH